MTGALKTIIVTALSAEAKPLIAHFHLKKSAPSEPMEFFENDGVLLIRSGVGKIRAAAAASFALTRADLHSAVTVINVGIGGASRQSGLSVGAPFLIHKLVDHASGREFFPDMTVDTGLAETHLTTVDRPVLSDSDGLFSSGIVDMEGSGFFEAAAMFVLPHQIACVKIVSDHFETSMVSKKPVEEFMEGALSSLDRLIDAYRSCNELFSPMMREETILWIETVSKTLRLTVSQKVQLHEWSARRIALGRKTMPPLSDLLSPPAGKQERNRRLAEIQKRLLSP